MDRDLIKYVILKYIDKSIRVMPLEYYKYSQRDFNSIDIVKVEYVEISKEEILKRYPHANFIGENLNVVQPKSTLIGRIANVFKKKEEPKIKYTKTEQIGMTRRSE